MKFRSDDTVTIKFSNDRQINIVIGPVVNRMNCCFCFYKIVLSDDDTKRCVKMYNDDATFSYKDFKKKFKIDHVAMMEADSLPMTNQDMLNDLDFIKNEITNCKIKMNSLKQEGDMMMYNFYNNLIRNKQYEMFQFQSKETYHQYLDKISEIIDSLDLKSNENMDNINVLSNHLWANNVINAQSYESNPQCSSSDNESESDEPKSDKSESDEPESDEPESDESESDEPESDESEFDEPETRINISNHIQNRHSNTNILSPQI